MTATPGPHRLLVISATIGEGHNATARAVEERARALWPGCTIRRVDTLVEMGRWVGPGFRWIYRVNVDTTPWLYDFFYRCLWRHRWFAASSCRLIGAWSGWRLAPIIEEYQPDLVVSTYPLGTAGLDWIRRRGGLDAPVAAIISDFAPHPFWVYSEVDLHYVASEASLRAMHQARPDARGAVGAPPVVSAFRPAGAAERIALRRRAGLPAHQLVVLVSCGSLGFGSMARAVTAGLAAGPQVCVVAACGHNTALRARLEALGMSAQRLVVLGWSTEMPALTAAADVVVTNAGGASALEAVACGRAVLMFEPIAGHGKGNAELMVRAGLARRCAGPAQLSTALRELATQPALLASAEDRALRHIGALDLDAEIAALPGLVRHHGARPLAAPDAFFAYAATPMVCQQVGAVLLLADHQSLPPPEQLAHQLAGRITERVPALPMLRRRLDLRPGRRPRWLLATDIDPRAHLRARTVGTAHGVGASAALREFFATPVSLAVPPWQLEVLYDADTERTLLLAKVHHSLGDGLAVTATLLALFTDAQDPRAHQPRPRPVTDPPAPGWRARARHAARVLRGLVSLACAGGAPPGGPAPGPSTPARDYAMVELPAATVRAAARECGVGTTALLLALLGEALHHIDPAATGVDERLRAMVPRTTRALRRPGGAAQQAGGYQGNHTAALALDLPIGPMPLGTRAVAVAAELNRLERAGQLPAAHAVVAGLGHLPAPLHAWLVRSMYRRRFCTLITSVLPGPRKMHYVWGVRVASVFPVLPLAEGVGLAVGFLTWGDMIGVGVTTDTGLLGGAGQIADSLARSAVGLESKELGTQTHPAAQTRE